jgi:hypothetical protein
LPTASVDAQYGRLLHGPGRPGHVALACRPPGERWQEKTFRASELPEVLPYYAGMSDVFLSTQRFWGWRRIARLAECGTLAVDVDFHKVKRLRYSHPLGVLEDCRVALERSRKPQPSLAIASGRGIYLLWLHEPIPRGALTRWNACQRELWNVLKPLGADRGALDAARVLRLVGSRHSGAGLTVEALTPAGDVWDFDDLSDEVLPLTRAEIVDLRIRQAAADASRPTPKRKVSARGFDIGTLWEARLSDLQALVGRARWFGELPDGQRDYWMFLAVNAISWLAPPERLERKANALAREVTTWDDRETRTRLQAVFKRARMAARGETIEWRGAVIDPATASRRRRSLNCWRSRRRSSVRCGPSSPLRKKHAGGRKSGAKPG